MIVNYFEVLNVSENAEKEVINSAYKALAKKYHPDNTKLPKENAAEKMTVINEAYRVLSDDKTRQEYLRVLHEKNTHKEGEWLEKGGDVVSKGNKEKESFDNESVIFYVICAIIIISVVCCIIYFGPEIWNDIWRNIKNGAEDIMNTF